MLVSRVNSWLANMNNISLSKISINDLHNLVRTQILHGFYVNYVDALKSVSNSSRVQTNHCTESVVEKGVETTNIQSIGETDLRFSTLEDSKDSSESGFDVAVKFLKNHQIVHCASDLSLLPSIVVVSINGLIMTDLLGELYLALKLPWYRRWFFSPKCSNLSFLFATNHQTMQFSQQKLHGIFTKLYTSCEYKQSSWESPFDSSLKNNSKKITNGYLQDSLCISTKNDSVQTVSESNISAADKHRLNQQEEQLHEVSGTDTLISKQTENTSLDELNNELYTVFQNPELLKLRRIYINGTRFNVDHFGM